MVIPYNPFNHRMMPGLEGIQETSCAISLHAPFEEEGPSDAR
jgi:hypothetical protein